LIAITPMSPLPFEAGPPLQVGWLLADPRRVEVGASDIRNKTSRLQKFMPKMEFHPAQL
jgi:hypothetical protein